MDQDNVQNVVAWPSGKQDGPIISRSLAVGSNPLVSFRRKLNAHFSELIGSRNSF
jgi:hypothetical protein